MKLISTFVLTCALASSAQAIEYSEQDLADIKATAEILADDLPFHLKDCAREGVRKLFVDASIQDTELDFDSVVIDEIDDRWWSPSRYVWFRGVTYPEGNSLIGLTQKPTIPLSDCF